MEAQARVELTTESNFSIDFVPLENKDAIIFVRYLPNVNRELMNLQIEHNKGLIAVMAKNRGWSSWLKIQEDVKMDQLPTK